MNRDQLHGRAKSAMGKLENAGGKVEAAWGDTKQGVKEDNKKLSESSD